MKNNFTQIIMLLIILSASSQYSKAEDIILGEFKGESTLSVLQKNNNQESTYVNKCKMAYNLNLTSTKLNMDFGVVNCEQGMDTWNDGGHNFVIQDNKIYSFKTRDGYHEGDEQGIEVGQLNAEGVATFTVGSVEAKTYNVPYYDMYCDFDKYISKEINVGQILTFTVQKLSDESYQLSRKETSFKAISGNKKDWANCPATTDYSQGERHSEFDVQLNK